MKSIPGPRGAVRVERGAWGYPTIHARDRQEATWALGWMHATDRLLQVQITRLLAEGRMMEILGDKPFARRVDRAVRALHFARGVDEDLAALPEARKEVLQTYCQGFEAGAQARGWPLPLRLLGQRPRRLTPRDLLVTYRAMSWFGLTSTAQLAKAVVAELLAEGAEPEAIRALLGPGGEGLDLEAARAVDWEADEALLGVPVLGGSNAFGIAGARSRSGGAIVLAEFHMQIGELPPVVYAVDVREDGGAWRCGVSIPGQPHLLAGRNEHAAWSYTFGHADNIDLTVETVRDDVAWVGARAEPLVRRTEQVRVRGGAMETWSYRDLPGGGSVLGRGDGQHAAVRWRGLERSVEDLAVLQDVPDCTSVDALVALHRRVRALGTAAVFGDDRGHIAWMHTGVVGAQRSGWGPRRRTDDDADLPEDARPLVVDPPEGVVAAANEACAPWTAFPEPRYRKQRMLQRLAARPIWDEAAAERITVDEVDLCAERLLRVWAPWLPDQPEARALIAWACAQEGADVEAARGHRRRFHRLHHEVSASLMAWLVGAPAARRVLGELGLQMVLQEGLDDLLAHERPDVVDLRLLRRLVHDAWHAAASPGENAMPDTIRFVHPLERGALPATLGLASRRFPVSGGPTSLFQLRAMPFLGETLLGGPAFRLLMDLGVSGARFAMAGGASERTWGPGYGEGLEDWAAGRYQDLGPRGSAT